MASIQGVGRHWTLFKVSLWISSASCTTTWGSQGVSFPAKPVIHSRCVCCLRFLSSHPTCFLLIKIRTCFPDCLAAALVVVAWGETSNTDFIPDVSNIWGSSTHPFEFVDPQTSSDTFVFLVVVQFHCINVERHRTNIWFGGSQDVQGTYHPTMNLSCWMVQISIQTLLWI